MKVPVINAECQLAGVRYRAEAYRKAKVVKGDMLQLKAEPTNEYDAFAIQVLKKGVVLGYIPRTHNQVVHLAVTNAPESVTCEVHKAWPDGCMLNIQVLVDRPDLAYEEPL